MGLLMVGNQNIVYLLFCVPLSYSFVSCAYCFQLSMQAGTHVVMQLQIYPAMLKWYCADCCSHIVLCLTFAVA